MPMPAIAAAIEDIKHQPVVSPTHFAHVVFRTSQIKAMSDWYKTALNAHAAFETEMLVFLTYDEEHHRVAILNVEGLAEQPDGVVGLQHIAYSYKSLHELLGNYVRLREKGIVPKWSVNHGPTTSLYYSDPDGNQVEFQVDNYDSLEEATAFFYSEAFAVNPIGVPFDPDALYERLLAGEDERQLKLRPPSGPAGPEIIGIR
ncbi:MULTISPECIES: VOC family protein [Sphingobium]|uniref:Biphenyl 2,3-dioxygenase n=1 Tax=Sphingobium fuliginis ATCC 27551 TaxID=1208342 RepID=A0A5B8CLF0_SPHSA|nr:MULTISPECIES: VOC family protein [Sphingobium]QDC37871.1 biphenyl 2,3-dioxygenase [Sphingobium fuliginis ATCC 27551]RYM00875.1 biphenyl 2,3-dioxygenase [Sphingobium fuliginis]UXC89475.1 VOC family protein [Sphingobium sp. RSMS]WDA38362.1 VOC family protein [Sphingobium sp. YC-XJ3]